MEHRPLPRAEEGKIPDYMRVVGTAGHVDHGKSSLVEALTGTHPDRLKEEQARQMTIDLGFGWLTLPDGREIGLVDVPGHSDFIENMVAGATGIDAVVLVIAADEGVRPQTTEHLAIIDLLGVRGGVIALTKADLVADNSAWDAIEVDVRKATKGTVLQDAPRVRVSSRTRLGLPELLEQISSQLNLQQPRADFGSPRLALDRVFSMEGFGTVVTGTLIDGGLAVGDEVEIMPAGLRARVRGLQHHRRRVERASPGPRTAVNLAGIQASQLKRGDVLTHPGQFRTTRRVDVQVKVLPNSSRTIEHNREVKMFIGTTETIAITRLLGTNSLTPGQAGLMQLELEQPVVCARTDAFILRWPSPPETIGGGVIIDPHPRHRHKRFDAQALTSLERRALGATDEILYEVIKAEGPGLLSRFVPLARLPVHGAGLAVEQLLRQGRLVALPVGTAPTQNEDILLTSEHWDVLSQRMIERTADFHVRFPLRAGIPREELKTQLKLDAHLFAAAVRHLIASGRLMARGNSLALPQHEVRFGPDQQAAVNALLARFDRNPSSPPSVKECRAEVGEELFGLLKESGELISVNEDVAFRSADYDLMVKAICNAIETRGPISLAEVRDLLRTSRKYAQALLEHLDGRGITRREGETRVLVR